MKWFVLMSVVAVAACVNPVHVGAADSGCSAAECSQMVQACRAESSYDPNAYGCARWLSEVDASTFVNLADAYCVKTCQARPDVAQLVTCAAAHATECLNDYASGSTSDAVFAACDVDAGQLDQACADQCALARTACDDRCSGGTACLTCLRSQSADCSSVCPDGGLFGCMNCSAACGLAHAACTDSCYH